MADRKNVRTRNRGGDQLQSVGVSSLSGPEFGGGKAADRVRVIDGESFLSHYAHLQVRRRLDPDARSCCREAPTQIIFEVENMVAEPELDESSGIDEAEPSPPALSGWWDSR